MRGLKLLFKEWVSMPASFWMAFVLGVGSGLLPFLMHEEYGSEDYLMPKLFIMVPLLMITEVGLISGCRSLVSNRLMRSAPIAKELYTRSMPLFATILTLGTLIIVLIAYFIFLGVKGVEICHYSDTLICAAVICLPVLMSSPLAAMIPIGGLYVMYFGFPFWFLMVVIGGDKLQSTGFGAPLWLAAVILAASLIIGIGFMFWLCNDRFKKSNVKIAQTQFVDNSGK